jgi:hypothetical protein
MPRCSSWCSWRPERPRPLPPGPHAAAPAACTRSLREAIQQESLAADDNLRCLGLLEEPCQRLAAASPAQIPGVLPAILHRIRAVWKFSRFYNTPHHIVGLLRKVRAAWHRLAPAPQGLQPVLVLQS